MKRAILGAMTLAALMSVAACGHNDETPQVNPKLDGLSGQTASVDPTIFDNQAEIYRKIHPPAAPAPAPTTAPATAPSGESTTAPGEGAPPVESPAPGDNAPPPPPG